MGKTIKISNDRKNNTPYITEIFRTVEDGTTLSFENGIYNFYADGAKVEYLCPVCNKSSEKKIPLLFGRRPRIDKGVQPQQPVRLGDNQRRHGKQRGNGKH